MTPAKSTNRYLDPSPQFLSNNSTAEVYNRKVNINTNLASQRYADSKKMKSHEQLNFVHNVNVSVNYATNNVSVKKLIMKD